MNLGGVGLEYRGYFKIFTFKNNEKNNEIKIINLA